MKDMSTQVTSKIDFTVTKDDVFTVLISEKEQELKAKLEAQEKITATIRKNSDTAHERLIKALKNKFDISEDCDVRPLTRSYSNEESYYIETYDIHRLEGMKRPDLAKDKIRNTSHTSLIFEEYFDARKEVNIDGYVGTLTKSIKLVPTKALSSLLDHANQLDKMFEESKASESKIRYTLLTLEFDKTIKATLIKTVVGTTDYAGLLLGK